MLLAWHTHYKCNFTNNADPPSLSPSLSITEKMILATDGFRYKYLISLLDFYCNIVDVLVNIPAHASCYESSEILNYIVGGLLKQVMYLSGGLNYRIISPISLSLSLSLSRFLSQAISIQLLYYLCVFLSNYLSICLSLTLSLSRPVSLCVFVSIYLSILLYSYLTVRIWSYLYVCLSVTPYLSLSVYLSIHLFICCLQINIFLVYIYIYLSYYFMHFWFLCYLHIFRANQCSA